MTYSKRQKAHWNQGKGCKGNRKAKEKVYTEAEIDEMIADQDPAYRTKHLGKRKPNLRARLEYRIQWCEEMIAKRKTMGMEPGYWRQCLSESKKKLAVLKGATDDLLAVPPSSGKVKK